jgi:hypothetical protein
MSLNEEFEKFIGKFAAIIAGSGAWFVIYIFEPNDGPYADMVVAIPGTVIRYKWDYENKKVLDFEVQGQEKQPHQVTPLRKAFDAKETYFIKDHPSFSHQDKINLFQHWYTIAKSI